MPTKILLKKGLSANISSLTLASGEPAFTTDNGKLYVGNGASNVLINPLGKPAGLNVTNFYAKQKVNDFGQVVAQAQLSVDDVPTLPTSKISGLGTCATVNTGIQSGQIPVLDAANKFPTSVIPTAGAIFPFIVAWYNLTSPLSVNGGANFVYDTKDANFQDVSLSSEGYVQFNTPGTYYIYYHATSKSATISTALFCPAIGLLGGYSKSTSNATPSYVSADGTYIFSIGVAPQKVTVQNIGTTALSLESP
ncbi:MAG: hypothetical protein RSC44_01970, partial [Clostridia bacterium]